MSTTQVDNIIITQEDYAAEVGNPLINYTGSHVNLMMNPVQGYSLDWTDFTWNGTPGNGVDNVTFFYAGGNQVGCRLTINPTYEVPVGGVSFPVCISGKSTLIPISLTTTFAVTSQNASRTGPTLPGEILSNGDRGSTTQVIDATLTADTGYRFASTSEGSYNIQNAVATSNLTDEQWNVVETWGTDSNTGDYTSYRIQADYTFPAKGGNYNFTMSALAEAMPAAVPKIINGFDSGDFSSVNWKGTSRGFTMFGTPGATFSYSLDSGPNNYGSGNVTVAAEGYGAIPVLTFPQRAATGTRNFTLTITATTVNGVTTTLNSTPFGGSTTAYGFTIVQTAQDTVFITRNVTVVNSSSAGGRYSGTQGWVPDGLGFGYVENETFIKREYPMSDTLSSPGVTTTITDVFEVPINKDLLVQINYTQHSTSSPGHYYLRSVVTGMTSGDGTTDETVANSSGAEGQLSSSVQSPGPGAATAGVISLLAQDSQF